jgi:hypothetical protein
MPVPRPCLVEAFDRIDDFLTVQGLALDRDAVLALQAAVGVDEESRAVIRARVEALRDSGHGVATGSLLLGILVGLFAAEDAAV